MNPPAKTAFRTKRLYVYQLDIKPQEAFQRAVYVGVLKDDEEPWPVIIAQVLLDGPYDGHVLESIWTMAPHQNTGYAKELWLGLEKSLNRIVAPGAMVSNEGEALAASVEKARSRSGPRLLDSSDPKVAKPIKAEFMKAHRSRS